MNIKKMQESINEELESMKANMGETFAVYSFTATAKDDRMEFTYKSLKPKRPSRQ